MCNQVRILVGLIFCAIILLLGILSLVDLDSWIGLPVVTVIFMSLMNHQKRIDYLNGEPVGSLVPKLFRWSLKPWSTGENWLINLSFWIPRPFREAMVGDILEDCVDLRKCGYSERRIRIHVVWHFILAVLLLWSDVLLSPLFGIIKRALSIRKE